MRAYLDVERLSIKLRQKAIDRNAQKILISKICGSNQTFDMTELPNCNGFGRIRHFIYKNRPNWVANPLPVVPAAARLSLDIPEMIRAQVYQCAVCNIRCWFCFVDYKLLMGNVQRASFFSCDELLDMYLSENDPPNVLDLTGGQPDLIPEWIYWMMATLRRRNLDDHIFLWSDDNLTTDYFWRFLTPKQQRFISEYPNYARVCCFKGIDEESFSFNTGVAPEMFKQQLIWFRKLLELGLDLYGYLIFTTPHTENLSNRVSHFVDQLQNIHYYLPLRVVPIEITLYTPTKSRMTPIRNTSLENQYHVLECWQSEIQKRFTEVERSAQITGFSIRQ